jgi:hypothetical protein
MSLSRHLKDHASIGYPLRGSSIQRAVAPLNPLSFDGLTPTIFCDLSKALNGAGTFADPYQISQANSVMNTDKAGTILGLTGTSNVAAGRLNFAGLGSTDPERPVIIIPYGAPPVMECGTIVTDWVVESGNVWRRSIGTNVHEVWQDNRRIYQMVDSSVGNTSASLAADLTALNAVGPGFAFINRDTDIMYIIPYSNENPNLGQIYTSTTDNGIRIAIRGVAGTQGNVMLCGLEIRHSRLSAVLFEVQNSNPTGLDNNLVVGIRAIHCGIDINTNSAAEGSGISFYGLSDTVRHSNFRLIGNYFEDIGNNNIETNFLNGGLIEWNEGRDCNGHGIVELYRSCANTKVLYNKCDFPNLVEITGAQSRGNGVWTNTLNAAGTNDNAVNTDNTVAFNAMLNCPRVGMEDTGQSNLLIYNNLIMGGVSGGSNGVPCILNGANLVGAETTFKNNIVVDVANTTEKIMDMETPTNLAYVADNNIFYAAARAAPGTQDGMYTLNGTVNNTFVVWKTILWGPGAATADANSIVLNPNLKSNGVPYPFSPALNRGQSISGFNHDLNGKPLTQPIVGPYLPDWT